MAIFDGFSRALLCVTNDTPSRAKGQTLTVKYDFKPLISFSISYYLMVTVSQICQLGWNWLNYIPVVTTSHLHCQFVGGGGQEAKTSLI